MTTEVESKYIVPDQVLFRKLLQLRQIGPFQLQPLGTTKITDEYLDTRGKALLRQGWACRLRLQDGAWILNLKGPGQVHHATMSRDEFEVRLPDRTTDLSRWPKGALRDQVVDLAGGLPLRRLLRIEQTRHPFALLDGDRHVAQLSLDEVRSAGRGVRFRTYMLECELMADGQVGDLDRLDALLLKDYMLIPEPKSKLQRALDLIQSGHSLDDVIAKGSQPVPLSTLLQRYSVDKDRGHAVADVAQQLFEGLAPWHGLPDADVSLLRTAALLHNVGDAGGHAKRHIIGRDILMRQPLEGLDPEEQRILAVSVYLHRGTMTAERVDEVLPRSMPDNERRRALVIASLVRLASALTLEGEPATAIQRIEERGGRPLIGLAGPLARKDAIRARKRTDLWEMTFDTPIEWRATARPIPKGAGVAEPIIYVDDSMAQAAAKILQHHFEEMLRHEEGTLRGRDPEALHDMRVAARRLRSALGLFGPYIAGSLVREVSEELRFLGQVLGEVRDLDVALLNLRAFASALPRPQARSLTPLRRRLRMERRVPRRRLLHYLRSRRYAHMQERFRALLDQLDAEADPVGPRRMVGNVAPRLLYLFWERVLAYDTILEGAPVELLHVLRIDCKRLRYALEFFQPILPSDIVELIPEVKGAQDHLGELHDAAVAIDMLDEYVAMCQAELEAAAEVRDGGRLDSEGVRHYREVCERVIAERVESFPEVWRRLRRKRHRRRFDALLGKAV